MTYAENGTAFGQPIGAFQHNRFVLAELDTELTSPGCTWTAAWKPWWRGS